MAQESIVGFALVAAVFAVIIKIAVLVYFFVLLNRLIKAVERIEHRCQGMGTAPKEING